MAFTDERKVQIRFFLGYPFPFQQYNPRLEGAIDLVGANATAKTMVEVLLDKLLAVYGLDPSNPGAPAQVDQAVQQAGIKVVESADDRIEFGTSAGNGTGSSTSAILSAQNDVARQLVGALSIMMGVEIANNIFGPNGYQGDAWGTRSTQMSIGPKTLLMGC